MLFCTWFTLHSQSADQFPHLGSAPSQRGWSEMLLLKKKPDPSPVEVRATLAGEPPAITNEASAAPAVSRTVESRYVYAMAVLALIVGLPMGYLLRGSDSPAGPPAASARQPSAAAGPMAGGQMPTLEQMKQAADKQAAASAREAEERPKQRRSARPDWGCLRFHAPVHSREPFTITGLYRRTRATPSFTTSSPSAFIAMATSMERSRS